MMKTHPNRSLLVRTNKKVVPFAALTFFLCLITPAFAITNTVTGTAFGTDYATLATQGSISSVSNGLGSLSIGFAGTTNISINHNITGFLSVSNDFDRFMINAGNSVITNGTFTALSVTGGTNLYLNGGNYKGVTYDVGFVLPPIPGQPALTNTVASAAMGALINKTENVIVAGTSFSGAAFKDTNGNVTGRNGLSLIDSSAIFTVTGAVNAVSLGGNAGAATSTTDTFSFGGHGIEAIRSSILISNGTFRGGNAGAATATGNNNAVSLAGSAILASSTSTVEIVAGSFTGGSAGVASAQSGIGRSQGGAALELQNQSSAIVHGGTFIGGSGTAAVRLWDSHLTTYGGNFNGGGLYSQSTGGTNNLDLMGGSFSAIELINATNGYQLITVNSNVSVAGMISQNGGTVSIDNLSNDALQNINLLDGSMVFLKDYTLSSNGVFKLDGDTSEASFQQDLNVSGELDIGVGQVAATGALGIKSGAMLKLKMLSTNPDDWGEITAGSAVFEANSAILVDASLAGFSKGSVTNSVLSTTGGISGFSPSYATVLTTTDTNVAGRTSGTAQLMDSNRNLAILFNTQTYSNYWGATGELAVLADELDTINNSTMNAILNNLGAAASKAAVEETYFTTLNSMQTALNGLNAALGQSISRGTEFRETLNLPKGAEGPEQEEENEWRFWAKYYGQLYSHRKTKETEAYDTTLHGGVLGVDRSYGPLLIGISGGMGNYRTESDNDSEESANAAHGAIYSTIGVGHSFLDAGIAYGYNNVESETGGPLELAGDFDSQLFSGYIGGGIGFELPKISTVITPEVSVQYSTYTQEAYTETSTTAIPRSFDEFDADSFRSSLGVNVAMLNTKALKTFGFKIEGRFHWLREFNADPGDLNFQLVGGGLDYQIASPSLDEDVYRAGIGFSFFNTSKNSSKNVMLRLDFDELFGEDFNSHNLAAKVIYAF